MHHLFQLYCLFYAGSYFNVFQNTILFTFSLFLFTILVIILFTFFSKSLSHTGNTTPSHVTCQLSIEAIIFQRGLRGLSFLHIQLYVTKIQYHAIWAPTVILRLIARILSDRWGYIRGIGDRKRVLKQGIDSLFLTV